MSIYTSNGEQNTEFHLKLEESWLYPSCATGQSLPFEVTEIIFLLLPKREAVKSLILRLNGDLVHFRFNFSYH